MKLYSNLPKASKKQKNKKGKKIFDSFVFSAEGNLISAPAAPNCGEEKKKKKEQGDLKTKQLAGAQEGEGSLLEYPHSF